MMFTKQQNKNQGSIVEKLVDSLLSPLKRVNVFFQILTIALMMFVFLSLEGMMGIFTIATLNHYSRDTFDNGFQVLFKINEFQRNFERLQTNYLRDILTKGNSAAAGFLRVRNTIRSEISVFKKANIENIENMEKEIAAIEKILEKPVSEENYRDLETSLASIKFSSDNAMGRVRIMSMVSMDQGEGYSNKAKIITVILLVVGTGLAVLLSLVIALSIARPLKSVKMTASSLATGDLTRTISTKGSLEVTSVVESLNKAILSLRELMKGIDEQSNVLYTASRELKNASQKTGKSAVEVAKAMEELAGASSEQAGQTSQAVETINALAELVRQVSEELKNISFESQSVADFAKLGQKATHDVADAIHKIYDMTKEVTGDIDALNKTSLEIATITSMIHGIAEQTTLLALNAAIEAARAGEQGKGFAVVAAETGKLAEQSKQAAQLITDRIDQMNNRSQQAVFSVNNGLNVVEKGRSMVADATVTFEKIFDKLGGTLVRIDTVALSAKKMADKNEGMIAAITNIVALSEESVASTEEVSAIAEEQNASVEQVNALAENLTNISGKLKQAISQFQIDSSK